MSELHPFEHQNQAFDVVANQQKALYLIAGTASGKTLAIALPLFHLLRQKKIRRVLFIYPTLALLDDQRRVMETLARVTNLQVAEIKGGMKRSELIKALNQPVILATPDAIYWFFRKNIKFNSLLIYGLAQVDAFVLDEAHLFNGLMLRSLTLLKERVMVLANLLNLYPQWHILTATPHEALYALTTNGVEIRGKSKCGVVGLDLLAPKENMQDGRSQMITTVNQVLAQGARKVLLVFNSAAVAHATFHAQAKGSPQLPADMEQKYGRVSIAKLMKWMNEEGIDQEKAIPEVIKAVYQHHTVPLSDLDKVGLVRLNSESIMARLTDLLTPQISYLQATLRDMHKPNTNKLITLIKDATRLDITSSSEEAQRKLDQWLASFFAHLESIWSESEIAVTTPNAPQIIDDLMTAGFTEPLAEELHKRLLHAIQINGNQLAQWGHLPASISRQKVLLSWAVAQVSDPAEQTYFRERLAIDEIRAHLKLEFPYIGLWRNSNTPVILYSGKMPKSERAGLIELFDKLDKAILVSTSAVEVGVDFSADVLITEQCPGPDLLQRFGRIGRRADIQGQVILQIHDKGAFYKLNGELQKTTTLSRELFSQLVTNVFPPRHYLSDSTLLNATHWLINEQIGQIGETLNRVMFPVEIGQLAQKIRTANLSFAFGLRSTLPQIGLPGDVTLDPFYALRKIANGALWPSDSPFEIAKTNMPYNRFIYETADWQVTVDWERTLQESVALFYQSQGKWDIRINTGIAGDYVKVLGHHVLKNLTEDDLRKIDQLVIQKPDHPLAKLGNAIHQLRTTKHPLVLGFGDVYLKRLHKEGIPVEMTDIFGTPIKLRDQAWLLVVGDAQQTKRYLEKLGFDEVEELIVCECGPTRLMLIESIVGACFQVYESWGQNPDAM